MISEPKEEQFCVSYEIQPAEKQENQMPSLNRQSLVTAYKFLINHIVNMDEWVIKNERRARVLCLSFGFSGILIAVLRVPVKLASITHTAFWMILALICLILSGLYAESLRRIEELPRIEYLRKKGIN